MVNAISCLSRYVCCVLTSERGADDQRFDFFNLELWIYSGNTETLIVSLVINKLDVDHMWAVCTYHMHGT